MKKYFLILLVLFSFGYKSNLQAEGEEIRHLWLHYYRYAYNDEVRHEYFKRADALGVNAIFMFVDEYFDNRPEYFQAIVDSAKNRGMKFFIAHSWTLAHDEITPNLGNVNDYLYRPLNMSEEQWLKCINSTDIDNRGFTSNLDKNNPNVRDLAVTELMKYIKEYPDIDGVAWDVSRMYGLFGSYHKSAQQYIRENSNIDIEVIKNEVYGKLPMPSFRSLSSVGINRLNPLLCKVLARYHSNTSYDYMGITLMEHENGGGVVCFNRNSASFEIPLYSIVAKKAIQNTGYKGDTIYVKEKSAYDFAFSIDMTPIYVDSVDQIPAGKPYIIIDGKKIDSTKAVKLKKHADTGACIIIGQPPYYSNKITVVDEITELMGFDYVTYVSPYIDADAFRIPEYLYITEEGRNFGIPESNIPIDEQMKPAREWMNWNANEMLGGTLRDMKLEMKKLGNKRRLNIGVTRYQSDPWYQQQDWATWLKNGYIDYNTIMNYSNSLDVFNGRLETAAQYFEDRTFFHERVQGIIGLYYNRDSKDVVIQQAKSSIEKKLKGFGIFEDIALFDKFTYDDCLKIGQSIDNDKIKFYYPSEIPIKYNNNKTTRLSFDSDYIDFTTVKMNSDNMSVIKLINSGENTIDIANISIKGDNASDFLIDNKTSFIIEPNSSLELNVGFKPETIGNKEAYLEIYSNDDTEKLKYIQLFGLSRPTEPTISINSDNLYFDSNTIPDTLQQIITVKNLGFDTLKLTDIGFLDNTNVFILSSLLDSELFINDSTNINIKFVPFQKGAYENSIFILSNDSLQDSTFIKVRGECQFPANLQINIK